MTTKRLDVASTLADLAAALDAGDRLRVDELSQTLPPAPTSTIRFPIRLRDDLPTGTKRLRRLPGLKPRHKLPIYRRDGYLDLLSPERWRLVHPGALRVLSLKLPSAIPTVLSRHNVPARYIDNSPVWFDVWPTVDHMIPAWDERSSNDPENLLCVGWWRNDTKGSRSLEATSWTRQAPGDLAEWDGLESWFHQRVKDEPSLRDDPLVNNWAI